MGDLFPAFRAQRGGPECPFCTGHFLSNFIFLFLFIYFFKVGTFIVPVLQMMKLRHKKMN